jgi:hypothetical protein
MNIMCYGSRNMGNLRKVMSRWRCDAQIKEKPRLRAEVNRGRRAARRAAVDNFASADAHSLMSAALDGYRSVSRMG